MMQMQSFTTAADTKAVFFWGGLVLLSGFSGAPFEKSFYRMCI